MGFVGDILNVVYTFITFIPRGISYCIEMIVNVPVELAPYMVACILSSVVLLILGRR